MIQIDDDILISYLNNELPQDKVDLIEKWVNSSADHKLYIEQLLKEYSLLKSMSISNCIDVGVNLYKIKGEINKARHRNRFLQVLKYSAAVFLGVIGATLVGAILTNVTTEPFIVSTGVGERADVMLPDGSKVSLNSNTKLAFTNKFWSLNREASLHGEAYFDIKHKFYRPFIVSSRGIDVKVLGTKFNVRSKSDENEIITTLLDGKVSVKGESIDEVLAPGDSYMINIHSGATKLFSYEIPENVLLWRTGKLVFDNTPLIEIAYTLEQIYNVELEFESKELEKEIFTCEFSVDDTIDNILTVLSLTDVISFSKINVNKIIIKKT